VIVYVDSSILARAYIPDEEGSADARRLLGREDVARVTGTFTRIEVSGALVRAERARRIASVRRALSMLDGDLDEDGRVAEVDAPRAQVEAVALTLVREHGLRALDALHLATAVLSVPQLADKGEPVGFASRDGDQATVAESLGFAAV
jgi:predicted nucleic acid-binding protein